MRAADTHTHTHTHTHTQYDYRNPRCACAPRVNNDDRQKELSLINWSMKSGTFVKLSLAEYVVVSLCLALVIAILFPAVHNHIISKATRLEHQSLYWGMVVVSNTFVYGLVFAAGRGWSIIQSCMFLESRVYHDHDKFLSRAAKHIINPRRVW